MKYVRRAALLAAITGCLATGEVADAAQITGFSDQHIGSRDPTLGGWVTAGPAYARILSPQVKQARYQVAWDVGVQAPTNRDVVSLVDSLNAAAALGLRPLISFMPRGTTPTAAQYETAFRAFRTQWPQVTEFTAWNEPNHPDFYLPAATAADFLQKAIGVCGSSCTVAAGDLAGDATPGPYYGDYVAAVANRGLNPAVWAYHPYEVVNNTTTNRFDGLRSFLNLIGSDKQVWFTEVGAFYCTRGNYYGPASQNSAATRLADLISSPSLSAYNRQLTRVYYYHLTGDWRPPDPSVGERCNWDSGLLDNEALNGGAPRPALFTLFPQARGHWWSLRNSNSTGVGDRGQALVQSGTPLVGDWNGDGIDTPGVFNRATGWWYLTNSTTTGSAEIAFQYGDPGDVPVVGDWDGNGSDTIGVRKGSSPFWYLRNQNSGGLSDIGFQYGDVGFIPLAGDWNDDGIDTPGVVTSSTWFLRNSNSSGAGDIGLQYGNPGDAFLVGDWNGDGADTPGVRSAGTGTWFLRNSNTTGVSDIGLQYGGIDDTPVVGDWNNDGIDTPGVVQ